MTWGALVEVIARVLEQDGSITTARLAREAGCSRESASNALSRQFKAGKLERELAPAEGPGHPGWVYR